jgi:hypothetical protein
MVPANKIGKKGRSAFFRCLLIVSRPSGRERASRYSPVSLLIYGMPAISQPNMLDDLLGDLFRLSRIK